ncbi:similar to Saccharomyces cerevisiae YLR220W CCC1 Putative vacuolar Fe2+/Mn2+ transporter [Maudiozyma barnettii]|uniref:Similar to Saccharomyces cerevisiae YLR220W CCC1 Putative vacuolar Fe2+/Mn2+ transporter n=1 Tax=Maudiozyma barnettii TaxID=61262 RepID=A0A8H2ZGV5_9SACH|nr:Ccc1p [Kazachstania barnettii]CAB4255024.1 similar to Saccharomyces cerevisiae YLR220W CCC1 Putative vacuolar Fe2+/Mn2+ transporter [Kazachstania barnettii]CAD1783295.1 similar to Saccharomyces cerevisiae YLR220W CCC1 Putative vacuolar Fe2+/Mn2+ transporter [Kazachstania barnettii]
MAIVAIKNAIKAVISSKSNDDQQSPLLNDSRNNSTYGSNSHDLEQHIVQASDKSISSHDDHNASLTHNIFSSIDPRVISDLIIGLSDGLTVPFALTAGLSSLGDSKLVITGGFAELISGAISMGLGGYLGAKSEMDYYKSEVKIERKKFFEDTTIVNHEVEDILLNINPNFSEETIVSFIKDLQNDPELMLEFLIKYGRNLDEPAENRQLISAVTIGGGYLLGGFVPLFPYFFVDSVGTGVLYSTILMAITLFIFGYSKAQLSMGETATPYKKTIEGVEMMAVGGIAAGAAWYFVKLLG